MSSFLKDSWTMVYKTKQNNLHISLLILMEKIFYLNMMSWLIFMKQQQQVDSPLSENDMSLNLTI